MFALRSGQSRTRGAARSGFPSLFLSREHFVLPRLLRRPTRLLARLASGDYTPPPFSASMATAALLALSGAYGAYVGGQMPAFVQAVTARSGFAVDQVRVTGHHETSEIDILGQLELDGWTSLVGFDADQARERISELPWVKTASVRKVYPDTLEVRIDERQPFAIWQHGSQLTIVERDGDVIAPFASGRHAVLPLVIGYGAAADAATFVDKIKQLPALASRVKGYIRVAERRWDLRLENGITLKLPENGQDEALAEVLRLDREGGLLSRDITAVDMRLTDRVVVQLTPDAALRREAALKERTKAAKRKPGQKI